jgi:hypothetical protein
MSWFLGASLLNWERQRDSYEGRVLYSSKADDYCCGQSSSYSTSLVKRRVHRIGSTASAGIIVISLEKSDSTGQITYNLSKDISYNLDLLFKEHVLVIKQHRLFSRSLAVSTLQPWL